MARDVRVLVSLVVLTVSIAFSGCALTKDCSSPSERYDAYNGVYESEEYCEDQKAAWQRVALVVGGIGVGAALVYYGRGSRKD